MTQTPRCERSGRVLRSRAKRQAVTAGKSNTSKSGASQSNTGKSSNGTSPTAKSDAGKTKGAAAIAASARWSTSRVMNRVTKHWSLPFRHDGHWLWIGGPVPRSAAGITFGSLVIVKKVAATRTSFPELLAHERVHVDQWREFRTVGFLRRYVGGYLAARLRGYGHYGAYRRIPFEIEAVWKSRLATVLQEHPDNASLAFVTNPETTA